MSFVPYVVEQSAHGERSYDIFSRLLNDRIIVLSEDVLCLCRYALLVAHVNHLLYILCAFDLIVRQNGAIEPLE